MEAPPLEVAAGIVAAPYLRFKGTILPAFVTAAMNGGAFPVAYRIMLGRAFANISPFCGPVRLRGVKTKARTRAVLTASSSARR